MKYLLQQNEIDALKHFLPEEHFFRPTSFGTFVNRYQFDKVVKNSMVKRIINDLFGDFDSWLESKKVYKYKIYKYRPSNQDAYIPPINIDFTTGLLTKLHKKTLPRVNGVPTSTEYYEKKVSTGLDAFGNEVYEYQNIICRIDFEIIYNESSFISKANKVIKWYYDNDTLSHITKNIGKIYSMEEDFDKILDEGVLRRGNVIKDIQYPLLAMLKVIKSDETVEQLLVRGRTLLSEMDADFKNYIDIALTVTDENSADFGKKVAYVKIRDYNGSQDWLDIDVDGTTPRQFIMNALDK